MFGEEEGEHFHRAASSLRDAVDVESRGNQPAFKMADQKTNFPAARRPTKAGIDTKAKNVSCHFLGYQKEKNKSNGTFTVKIVKQQEKNRRCWMAR